MRVNGVQLLIVSAISVAFLSGCETPERRDVRQRLAKLQAENSEVKARNEADVANARMEAARQRQNDLRVIEALQKKLDEINAKLDNLKASGAEIKKPETPATPAATETPAAPATAAQAELENARKETEAQMVKIEEDLARAQAQAEAAKVASVASDKNTPENVGKDVFKGGKLPVTKFVDSSGKVTDISQYIGKKNVVITIMKGFYSGGICIYCTKQTTDLARNIKSFEELDTEVLVVYPGKEEHINSFVRSVRDYEKSTDPRFQLPFKVLLDVNLDAVKAFNITGDLAHPTTFLLDKTGVVRYQYVGKTMSDRPTAATMLGELKKLGDAKP